MRRRLQHAWRFLLWDPFILLRHYFFKTDAFMSEVEIKDRTTRLELLRTLAIPMFLITYLFAFFLALVAHSTGLSLWLGTAIGVLSGLLVGAAWDAVANRPVGILGGMWFGLWLGRWAASSWSLWIAILLATIGGVALGEGVVKSVGKITVKRLEENKSYVIDLKSRYYNKSKEVEDAKKFIEFIKRFLEFTAIISEFIGYCVLWFAGGTLLPNIEQRKTRRTGIVVLIWACAGFVAVIVSSGIGGNIVMGGAAGILASVTLSRTSSKLAHWGVGVGSGLVIGAALETAQQPTMLAIIGAIVPAIVAAMAWRLAMMVMGKWLDATNDANFFIVFVGMVLGILAGHQDSGAGIVLLFPLCYMISDWQLPLSLLSFISISAVASTAESGKASEIIAQLRVSSFYWDEWEVRPFPNLQELDPGLPGLIEDAMKLIAEQDAGQATEILAFIEAERPLYFALARQGASRGFPTLIAEARKRLDAQDDVVKTTRQIVQLHSLATRLKLSRSPQWLEFLEDAVALVAEQNIEQAVEIVVRVEAEPLQLVLDDVTKTIDQIARLRKLANTLPQRGPELLEFAELLEDMVKPVAEKEGGEEAENLPFIMAPISSPLAAVQRGLREYFLRPVVREMMPQKTLLDISQATPLFARLEALSIKLNISDLEEVFASLHRVCLDAAHYLNALGWHARHDALQRMITNVKAISRFVSEAIHLEKEEIDGMTRWENIAQYELDKLQQEPQKTDQIKNPYVVGQALQPGTSLFVGRQDLVQQLEQSLRLGSHRPTFFLNGERRMGKSSTLRQLPILLDRHFLPIRFDVQAPGMTSNIAAFLSTVAESMSETIENAGMRIEPLANSLLQKALRENEAAVYYVFNEWLKPIEAALKQNECTMLLSFDEFENLESMGKKHLDLHLLLSWFRSVIQNHPQLALLFCGGKSVSEMGQETGLNWPGYFVNVQTLRVSFLHETDARRLITRPLLDEYPIAQIFGAGVVEEIICVTGCHPFLVQAVCSDLVEHLNADNRNCAVIEDVTVAVEEAVEKWEDGYFQDLWVRTNPVQRTCLIALSEVNQGNLQQITHHIQAGRKVTRETLQDTRRALQVLLKRDLIALKNESYQIATPIFRQWIERNS